MRIFLDTGDPGAIREAAATGLVDGVTTNPTHIAKTGRPFRDIVGEICSILPNGSISVEAMGETSQELINEAKSIASLSSNIVVKIPMNVEGLKAVPILSKEHDVRTNVTMVFSATQAFLAMKAGATYVSVVVSRLDAIANESDILVQDAVRIKKNYEFKTEVLVASLKTQNHVLTALRSGADIATVPVNLFFQMYKHVLTDNGLAQFQLDWQKVPK